MLNIIKISIIYELLLIKGGLHVTFVKFWIGHNF